MENLTPKIISEIAGHLNCRENCYYNSKTNQIITIPQFLEIYDDEEYNELFQKDIDEVNNHKSEYIKIEVLKSFESFKIMERFTDKISEDHFKNSLEKILQKKKPFRNFKYEIDNSEYREAWFEFSQKETEKIVGRIIESKGSGNY
jgi:hypothetical protein